MLILGRLINKIKNKFGLKHYCNRCIHHIPFMAEFDRYKRNSEAPEDDGKHICKLSFQIIKNDIGNQIFKTYHELERCPKCNQVTHDDREIRYEKCAKKNYKLKCKYFKARWFLKLLM